jgi:hypothetical protein
VKSYFLFPISCFLLLHCPPDPMAFWISASSSSFE